MPAESYGVKLSLQALVKAWVDHHPGGEHDHEHAERWLQSMMRLVDLYTATFRSSDWEELEDEIERYREDLAAGAFRNIVRGLFPLPRPAARPVHESDTETVVHSSSKPTRRACSTPSQS